MLSSVHTISVCALWSTACSADLEVALVSMARAASTSLCLMQKSMAVLPSLLASRAQLSESNRLIADGLLARQAQCRAVH